MPLPVLPATVAGLLRALDAVAAQEGVAAGFDLELVCGQPVHHRLEFAGLYGLLEGLGAARPAVRTRVWLRSALATDAPFALLPAAAVARIPGGAAAPDGGAPPWSPGGLARPGAAGVLLGDDAAIAERIAGRPGWWLAPVPRAFQWRLPDGAAARAAGDAFAAALAADSPHWLTAAPGPAAPVRSVLVFQARSHLGDALWLTPLLRALHSRLPGVRITVLAAPGAVPALATNPRLGELLILPPDPRESPKTPNTPNALKPVSPTPANPPDRVNPLHPPEAASPLAQLDPLDPLDPLVNPHGAAGLSPRQLLVQQLAARRFDAALFAFVRRPAARWLAETAAQLGIPWRVNLEYFDAADDGREASPLFTHEAWFFWNTLPSPRLLLHALDPLPGAAPAGSVDRRIELPLCAAWRDEAAAALAAAGIGDAPFAVLTPGARSSTRWPARKFAALALGLAADGLHVLIEGGAGDAAVLAAVEQHLRRGQAGAADRGRIVIRRDSFGALAALVAGARLLVSNDSAPIHLAEAAATPTLYFAHHEKLVHSQPAGPLSQALFDAARNRPARIPLAAALAAARGMLSSPGATMPEVYTPTASHPRQARAGGGRIQRGSLSSG